VTLLSGQVAAAFEWACRAELDAPKPGNVHVLSAGHGMTVEQFVRSAEAAAGPLSVSATPVGARILGAVEATFARVGVNTNLGIILLCAPLAAAAEAANADLRKAVAEILRNLDKTDAELAFRAIVRAAPAGLGRSLRYDVFEPATVSLRQAMSEAADRDRIARQYASDFADVFEVGLPILEAAMPGEPDPKWATLLTYLKFLSAFPDSHVARKLGLGVANDLMQKAVMFQARLRSAPHPRRLLTELLAWDATLKSEGINPGTSADLTVATLFAYRLRTILPSMRNGA
jgi:triphosphoribosyl-dephospho-CoA synthase